MQRGNFTQRYGVISFGPNQIGNRAGTTINTARSNSSKASQRYQNVVNEDEEFQADQYIFRKDHILNKEKKLPMQLNSERQHLSSKFDLKSVLVETEKSCQSKAKIESLYNSKERAENNF